MSILLVYPLLILIILFFRAGLYGRKSGSVSAGTISAVQDAVSSSVSAVQDDVSDSVSPVQDDVTDSVSYVRDDISDSRSFVRDAVAFSVSSAQNDAIVPAASATLPENKELTEPASSPLDSSQGNIIKAAACLFVILHHLVQRISSYGAYDRGLINVFNYMGVLFTALFFFFSGYGLIISLNNKPDYLRTFPWKRFPKVLIPFWLINFLGLLFNKFYYGYRIDSDRIFNETFGFSLVNSNGWFIIEIVVLYIIFYLLFNLIKNKDIALVLLCAATLVLIYYSLGRGHDDVNKSSWFRGEWWFNSTVAFIVGLFFARFKKQADRFFTKFYPVKLAVFTVLSFVSFRISVYAVKHYGYYHEYMPFAGRDHKLITLAAQSVACIFFVLFVAALNYRVRFGNKLMAFVGGMSLELFLVHGFVLEFVYRKIKAGDLFCFALVYAISLLIAYLISRLTSFILKKYMKLFDRLYRKPGTHERKLADAKREVLLAKARKWLVIILIIAVLGVTFGYLGRYIFAGSIYKKEMEALRSAKVGDEVNYGYFEADISNLRTERMVWIVIKKEEDKVCLLSKKGIAGSYYYQKHKAVDWENSDIRKFLNSEDFTSMFSRHERKNVLEINGDMFTLLTVKEAEEAFASNKDRELAITKVAESAGTNINARSKMNEWDLKDYRSSWWWLRGEEESIYAPIVNVDGEIEIDKKTVNRPGGAVRPVIWVSLNKS